MILSIILLYNFFICTLNKIGSRLRFRMVVPTFDTDISFPLFSSGRRENLRCPFLSIVRYSDSVSGIGFQLISTDKKFRVKNRSRLKSWGICILIFLCRACNFTLVFRNRLFCCHIARSKGTNNMPIVSYFLWMIPRILSPFFSNFVPMYFKEIRRWALHSL